MKNFICILLLAAALTACKPGASSFDTVESIQQQSELNCEATHDKLNYDGRKIETSMIDKTICYNNNELVLVSFKEKAVYITDIQLNVKKRIDLRIKYSKILTFSLFNAFLNKDTLFLADNSMSIKKLDLTTGEMKMIPLKGMVYFSQPYYMSFQKNGNYIYTFNCFLNTTKDKVKTGDYVVGAVFTPDGNLADHITAPKDIFEHDAIGKDKAFYSEFNGKHYLYFEMAKNILILDSLNNKIDRKSLYLNKDWTKPVNKGKQLSAYIVNTQPLTPYKNMFIHWPPPGNIETRARVVIYDQEFKPIKKVYLNGLDKIAFYSYVVCGDKLVVASDGSNGDPKVYIYDLKGI